MMDEFIDIVLENIKFEENLEILTIGFHIDLTETPWNCWFNISSEMSFKPEVVFCQLLKKKRIFLRYVRSKVA